VAVCGKYEGLRRKYQELRQENRELKLELNKNSHNSHKPPSSDWSEGKKKTNDKRRRGRKNRRRPGGQKGHRGHWRPLVPPERVDKQVEHYPRRCRRCARDIRHDAADPEPLHHQIAEIPVIAPTVTDHVLYRVTCPDCKTRTTARLPNDVPKVCFGPNLRSLVVLLSGRFRISRRETVELCRDVFGVSVSVGCVATMLERTSDALLASYQEIARAVQSSSAAYMDETGWREKGKALHLWILVVTFAVLFRIGRRTKAVAQELLGRAYAGIVISDRYGGYRWLPDHQHQVCWSHLKRNFEELVERGGDAQRMGRAFLKVSKNLFAIWHAYKDGRIPFETMQSQMAEVETRMGTLLQQGSENGNTAVRRLCVGGIEPTNNTGERGIRPAVQWRKTCFGTQSRGGSRFVERILTVVATCRQQGRPLLRYLRDVMVAADLGCEAPSLLGTWNKEDPRCLGPPRASPVAKIKQAG
jgi:transposase